MPSVTQSLTSQEIKEDTKTLVRYALAHERKRGVFRRDDAAKTCMATPASVVDRANRMLLGTRDHTRAFPAIYLRANTKLREVFGMEMVPLERPANKGKTQH